jgi:hypothetical protein
VAEGIVAMLGTDDTVTVLGQTEASMGGPELDTEMYPEPGEEVTLDLSETEPGAFGQATRYKVDWGDGTVTGWQESPIFTHTYEEPGEVTARATAGNDANQTASTAIVMSVGGSEPNWISERFAPENQDMTFGVLGVALALGGGVIGVGRRYRKRSRLQDELDALEQGFEELQDRPSECEPFLDNRKARARSLALDGALHEEQVTIVESRAEELRRTLRTGAVEEEFGFLPHALVVKARQMLEDGRVAALEAEAFLAALEEVEGISPTQRSRVRERIEGWHARDAGGRPS